MFEQDKFEKFHNLIALKQADLDRDYPNRHKEIYSECCSKCPSDLNKLSGIIDEESEDIKQNWSKTSIAIDGLFVCFMRQKKLCKGICDLYGINENDINKAHQEVDNYKINNPNWEKDYQDNYNKILNEAREKIKNV